MKKKTPTDVAKKNSNFFSPFLPLTAQMTQTEEFIIQNVAYRPTVYKTSLDDFLAIFLQHCFILFESS